MPLSRTSKLFRSSPVFRALGAVFRATTTAVVTFCVGNTFFTVVGYPACVSGASMRPALNDALTSAAVQDSSALSWLQLKVNWVFVNCWKARQHQFQRGDIVVFVSPKDPYDFVIKRLIGVEGDEVVNSDYRPLDSVVINRGACWVEGDNRRNSVDSNSAYGPISRGLIFGKATHVIWPPEQWRRLDPEVPETPGRLVEDIGNGNVRIVNK